MAIKVKDYKLKKKIMGQVDKYYNKAEKEFNKGNMKMGKRYEKAGDKIYKDNYSKIFKISK
jgi:hypothetical protein